MNHISMNDPESIQKAVAVLRVGGVIVYPTDTAYGLGADATNVQAVEKVSVIKDRDKSKSTPVIINDIEQARQYVVFNEDAGKLAAAYWPGALTLELPTKDEVLGRITGGDSATLGVRVPGLEWCREVARELGKPITSTSANAGGSPTEYSLEGVRLSLGENAALVDLWIDGGTLAGGPVSTVVRASEDSIVIKREGAISGADIKKVLE